MMKTSEQSSLPKREHRQRILSAAATVFLKKGYAETTTAEIARSARLSKRELYSHFRDKQHILAAVITQLQAEIQSEANISLSSSDNLKAVLNKAGSQILAFIDSEKFQKLFRIAAAESFRDPVSARKFYLLGPGIGRENTATFIKRQMALGHLRKADPLRAADDFPDLLVSARYLTAVVLGQSRGMPKAREHVRHAIDVFLTFYGKAAVK